MWKRKLAINVFKSFGSNEPERLRLLKGAGFDGFFSLWRNDGSVGRYAAAARGLGLDYQSVHAPFHHIRDLWGDDEAKAGAALDEQLLCLADCEKAGVNLVVVHAFIGFEDHTPTEIGLRRFARIVEAAGRASIRLAFENTEGEEYLAAVMERFRGCDTVGFCWDSGHEMCYNRSQDMLAKYGDRLLGTHLNDNLGISDHGGAISWLDDLHLLPFDGIADWARNGARLARLGFGGPLTFELNLSSKPGRHDNDAYRAMPPECYLAECRRRACRAAWLANRE